MVQINALTSKCGEGDAISYVYNVSQSLNGDLTLSVIQTFTINSQPRYTDGMLIDGIFYLAITKVIIIIFLCFKFLFVLCLTNDTHIGILF